MYPTIENWFRRWTRVHAVRGYLELIVITVLMASLGTAVLVAAYLALGFVFFGVMVWLYFVVMAFPLFNQVLITNRLRDELARHDPEAAARLSELPEAGSRL